MSMQPRGSFKEKKSNVGPMYNGPMQQNLFEEEKNPFPQADDSIDMSMSMTSTQSLVQSSRDTPS